jgi:hypothetical protein
MSSPPERQESEAGRTEPSPEVSGSQVPIKLTTDHQKHLLPTDLLDSSPEIDNAGTTTSDQAVVTPQRVRHHDLILDRNDRFVDDVWGRISEALPARVQSPQEPQTVSAIVDEPLPARPIMPQIEQPEVAPTRQQATFLAPGQGRTPEQAAAAARLRDAVTARARLRAEAESGRQASLTRLTDSAANDGAQVNTDRRRQFPRAQVHQGRSRQPARRTTIPATRPPAIPRPQLYRAAPPPALERAPFPAGFNNSAPEPPLPAAASPAPAHQPGATTTTTTTTTMTRTANHQGDSIFRQMMDQLITTGVTPPGSYQQVNLSFRAPFGMEYLFLAEGIHPQHWLVPRAQRERSGGPGAGGDLRAIRSARNGEVVGWREFLEGGAAGRIHLIPTPNPGKWVPK